jgi:integrase
MGRRSNGEGTITRRKDGRWEARYYIPTVNGTKRKTIYGKTQVEVRDKLTKALSDRIDGIVYDDDNMSVGEYLDAWLKGSVYGSVRRSTYDRDTYLINNHIKPIIGGLKLKKLNSAHVQSFYRDRLDAGLSASTVHKMHDILRRGLAQAVKWHLIPRNVADVVTPPRPVPKEMVALSADETSRLLAAARGDRLEALYILAVNTGLRQGELLALRWQDVDTENAVVSVRRTLTRSGGRVVFGDPKTKKSRRSIRLTPQAVQALRAHL